MRFYSQQHNFALNIEEGSPGREANNWGFRGGGGDCDLVSRTNFAKFTRFTYFYILAAFNDVFIFHKFSCHLCFLVAFHALHTNFLPSSRSQHEPFIFPFANGS